MAEVIETDRPAVAVDRARAAHAELLACVDAALTHGDPLAAAGLLLDLRRAAAEVLLESERAIGVLLRAYRDPGGRPPRGAPPSMARQLREVVGINRTEQHWLVRLADVDDAAWQQTLDSVWSGYPRAGAVTARHVVLAVEGEPTPSIPPSVEMP